MFINKPQNWKVKDPYPNKKLEEILSFTERATALYAREKNNTNNGFLKIIGAINMLGGLEYHHKNFLSINSKIRGNNFSTNKNEILVHEACAYLNRLGQFGKFYKSIPDSHKPSIKKIDGILINFRHKYSAHRNIDNKNPTEQDYFLELNFSCGSLWNGHHNRIFQTRDDKGNLLEFNLINDHYEIISEAYNVLEYAIQKRSSIDDYWTRS